MANKTYFKGKKKSTVKSKKYQFAGFDEATQIDNTEYLNALYNPNYYDATAVNNEDIKQNVLADVATGQKLAMDKKVMQTTTDANLKRLQGIKNEAEAKIKQQFSEANQQSKDQAIISSGTDLLTKGVDIAKQFMKPLAPATNAATTGSFSLPSNIGTLSTSGVQPGLQLGKQGINLGKGTFTSQMGSVGGSAGKTMGENVAKKGFTSALGSSTWATPGAAATAGGVGAALSIGGKLWDTLSEDDNPYEYTKKEKWGDWGGNLLSEIGTYGGLGASFGPIGAGIGAAVGAGIGTFKAIRESKKNKKQAADLNARKAEEDRLYQEQLTNYNNALASQQRFYDYSKNQLRNSILTGEERMRQNRLMGLTEGQLAGNTNIAMTGGGRKYFGKGGVNVPGGQVVPIGQGAVEFVGRSHAQGGIRLDAKTEVEGGETMDKVMMTGGKFNDYFFSDYLKNGGKSFAQHHKELIKRGASQKEIQALAKKQEAMANRKGEKDRSPNQVAEYGGLRKYQTGNFKETADAVKEGNKWVVRDEQGNILGESMDKNAAEKKAQNKVSAPQKKNESTTQKGNTNITPFSFKNFLDYQEEQAAADAGMAPLNTIESAPTTATKPANSKFGPYKNLPAHKIPNNFGALGFKSTNSNPKDNKEDDKKDAYSKMYSPEQIKTAKILAGIGFGSQMIAPISSIFMKPNLVSAPTPIVPGMIDTAAAKSVAPMISAGGVEAPRLGRVTPETEDIMNRDVANRQFFSNIGDPSSMIAMIASTGKTNEAERKAIADAQRTNVELAGKEGMLKFEASKANVASSLEAQRANQAAINEAQGRYLNVLSKNQEMKNQAYLANLDAQTKTRLANAQLLTDKQNRDIAAMSTFGTNVAGGVGDFLSYGIEGEKSRMASGDTGVYERNFIPIFGTNKSKTGGVKKKMYGGTNSYTSRLGDLKFKRALKVK